MRTLACICIFFLIIPVSLFSQKKGHANSIDNIRVEQNEDNKVLVIYDLTGDAGIYFYIKMYVSKDNGKTYSPALKMVSGDVGGYIRAGKNKAITWNVFDEYEDGITGDLKFKITADYTKPNYQATSNNTYSSSKNNKQTTSERGARWLEVRLTENYVGFKNSNAPFLFTNLSLAFCTGYRSGRVFWLGFEGGYYYGLYGKMGNNASNGNPYYFSNTKLGQYTNGGGSYISSYDSYEFQDIKTSGYDISGFMLLRAYPKSEHFHWDFKLSASIYSQLYMNATNYSYQHYDLNTSTGAYYSSISNVSSGSFHANFNNISASMYLQFPINGRFGIMFGGSYSAYYTFHYINSSDVFTSRMANTLLNNSTTTKIDPASGSYSYDKEGFISSYCLNMGITF